MLKMISLIVSEKDSPFITLDLSSTKDSKIDEKKLIKIKKIILESYNTYLDSIAMPKIALIIPCKFQKNEEEVIIKILSTVKNGGFIGINNNSKNKFAFSGISKSLNKKIEGGNISLHEVAINLPKLSYESNKDEAYFRAKVALMLKIAISTLSKRRSIIDDITGKGLLPFLNTNIGIISSQKIPLIINLTGINEAINNLLGSESTDKEKTKLAGNILDTANEEIAKYAADLIKLNLPKKINVEDLESEMLKSFYKDSKKISNKRMKSFFGYELKYPTFKEGLNMIRNHLT